jgi:3'-5' exoribonuclease
MTKNRDPFQVMRLTDVTGHINGYAWHNKYRCDYYPEDNDLVHITGKTRVSSQNGTVVVDIEFAEPVPQEENPIVLLPECENINTDDILELIQIIDTITSPSLKQFLKNVFSDDSLARWFIIGRASTSYHHSYRGGLLQHSLECVRVVSRFLEVSIHEREVGIVGALLHDIVKTNSFYNGGSNYSPPVINHDSRTLEKLAGPLRELEHSWQDGAGLLRMILEYPLVKDQYIYKKHHVPTIVDLVWFADQLSASMDKQKAAFGMVQENYRMTKYQGKTHWRISSDNYGKSDVSS